MTSNTSKNSLQEGGRQKNTDYSSIKRYEGAEREGKYCNNKYTLTLPLCQGHPALCDLVCLRLYVSFFCMQGPFIHPIPLFSLSLSLSLFPTPPLPEAEIPHRSHSNVRLSHGAPFLILTQHQSETPPHPPNTQLCFSESRRVGEYLLYDWGYEKTYVDLGGDVRGDETGLSSACQHKINHHLDNLRYPRGHASSCREDLNITKYYHLTVSFKKKKTG